MSALSPGLYKATVRGVADVTVFVDGSGYGTTADYVSNHRVHEIDYITDARPLIVLMVPGGGSPRDNHWPRLAAYLRQGGWDFTADQIEAQTKPARIPEPGLWGVVESHGYRWVRVNDLDDPDVRAWANLLGQTRNWAFFTDPTLIREGVES